MLFIVSQAMMLMSLIAGGLPSQGADPQVPQSPHCAELHAQLVAAERSRNENVPIIEVQLREIAGQLETSAEMPDQPAQAKQALVDRRSRLEARMSAFETILAAHKAAVDACEAAERNRQELQHVSDNPAEFESMSAADLTAVTAELEHVRAAREGLATTLLKNGERLDALARQIDDAPEGDRSDLELQRRTLEAERTAIDAQIESYDVQQALLAARIKAIGTRDPVSLSTQEPAAEVNKEETEALNKQRMAEQLDAQARDQLGQARTQLSDLQARRDALAVDAPGRKQLERDIEFWLRVEQFEQRRIKQAELVQRAAQEKKSIAQLKGRLDELLKTRELLREERKDLNPGQRQAQAAQYRDQQEQALGRSQGLLEASAAKREEAEPLHMILPSLNAVEEALKERLLAADSGDERQWLEKHYRRIIRQLDVERQQIDLMIMTTENIAFAIARQADLERQLADASGMCAEVLVPTVPGFWERNRYITNSVKILAIAVSVSYGLKLLIWLIEHALVVAQRTIKSARVSLKRFGTLLGFFGSIVKLFVWVFAIIAILGEFGIDPKQSSGAIGLIGLILAGMFQQIVVDFVKGLDIVIGKHYYVGDFVEVDGKYGHVVDFDVKHTRIRTLSGQEFNLPNSRCVPSRRFPDGFVANYVDFRFKDFTEARRAQSITEAVGRDLNQRIEAIRDEPCLQQFFHEVQGGVMARYRVRVLPGCPWVINDYFIPESRAALSAAGFELTADPTHTFMNRVDTFRKLFSRQMTEEEIIREVTGTAAPQLATDDAVDSEAQGADER